MKWLLFLLPFRLLAQIQCDASVDRNVIEQFSRFQLTITLRGTSLNITSLPQIPELSGMRIDRNSVSESTQMSFVNFKKSEEHSFTYAIQAEQIGRWTIPPITIYNDGQPLSTHTITVEIIAAGDPSSAQDPANKKVEAFLELSFSKKTAVLGEQIVAEVNVYSKHPIRNFNPINFPSFRGFWAEDFTLPQRIEPSRKTIGGSTFLVYTIKKTAIFGQRVGTFTIEPCVMEFEIAVPRRTGGFMDNFFSPFNDPLGETVTIRLSPPPENISIGDLPPDAPLDFSGLVGSFEIKNSLDHDKIKVGEAISYQIEISGQGNIRESILLKNPFPGVFETYDPKISDEIKIKGELLGGKKVIEFIAIPRQEGEYDVAPFSLCYFDPKQKKYVTKTVNKKQLSVSKGAHPAESSPVVSKVDTVRGRSESVDLLIIKDIVFWATVGL